MIGMTRSELGCQRLSSSSENQKLGYPGGAGPALGDDIGESSSTPVTTGVLDLTTGAVKMAARTALVLDLGPVAIVP